MKFLDEPENYGMCLAQWKRDWSRATENFFYLAEHWEGISSRHYGSVVSVRKKDGANELEGAVFGKRFTVRLTPIVKAQVGYAEAVISLAEEGNRLNEAGRFLINREGSIVDDNGGVLVSAESDRGSVRMFASIVQAVLEQPASSAINHPSAA